MLNLIKHKIEKLIGKKSDLKIETTIPHVWYGNDYGGFYLCPDLLNQNSIVYSFGIGQDISFDKEIIEKHHCQVFGYDPTPKSIQWISEQTLPAGFHFEPFGLDNKSGYKEFLLPKIETHVSGSVINHKNVNEHNVVEVQMKTLAELVEKNNHSHIDVLKMDIEGSEYCVIDSILELGIPVKQILVEIHERFFEDGKHKTDKLMESLHRHGYQLFAISPKEEELSFIKI